VAADGGALACSPEQEPVEERAGEVGVGRGLVREFVFQPPGDVFDVIVAFVQDACVDEELADVALVPAGRELVQQLVRERFANQFAGARPHAVD